MACCYILSQVRALEHDEWERGWLKAEIELRRKKLEADFDLEL